MKKPYVSAMANLLETECCNKCHKVPGEPGKGLQDFGEAKDDS